MRTTFALIIVFPIASTPAAILAQQPVARIVAEPASIALARGDTAIVTLRALDAAGAPVDAELRVGGAIRRLEVTAREDGRWSVTGLEVGEHEVIASIAQPGGEPVTLRVPVRVEWPAVTRVEVTSGEAMNLYVGTRLRHRVRAFHADGTERPYPEATWLSSDADVATVDRFGNVRATATGPVTIAARVGAVTGSIEHDVRPAAAASITLRGGEDRVRTGDVQSFDATVLDAAGTVLADVPVTWSHIYTPDDSIIAPAAPAQLDAGRFVADVPGVHTVVASAGGVSAERSFRVVPRGVVQKVLGDGAGSRVTRLHHGLLGVRRRGWS
jgi:hypothetical protein